MRTVYTPLTKLPPHFCTPHPPPRKPSSSSSSNTSPLNDEHTGGSASSEKRPLSGRGSAGAGPSNKLAGFLRGRTAGLIDEIVNTWDRPSRDGGRGVFAPGGPGDAATTRRDAAPRYARLFAARRPRFARACPLTPAGPRLLMPRRRIASPFLRGTISFINWPAGPYRLSFR